MFKKNSRLLTGVLCAMLAAALVIPAAAHGGRWGRVHHGGVQQSIQTAATACSVENCTLAGYHTHDGVTYCGHSHGAGVCDNSCRALCANEDCTLTGYHTHDGVGYCGYNHVNGYCDGSCAVAVCAVEGCTLVGQHSHDGVSYCGYSHTAGYCDGVHQASGHHGYGHGSCHR